MNLAPLLEELASNVAQKISGMHVAVPSMASKLDPWKAYTVKEAAEILGLTPAAVYAIPDERLQRVYTGSAGTTVRFMGIHLLYHLAGQRGPSMEELLSSVRPPVAITPLHTRANGTSGRVRLL